MKRIKYIHKIIACLTLAACTSSCLKDNRNCDTFCTLTFTYTFNAEEKELFNEVVNEMYLYLFDERGHLYASSRLNKNQLSTRTLSFEIEPGRYTAVAWGNPEADSYRISGESSLTDLGVQIVTHDGEADGSTGNLFHGMAAIDATLSRDTRHVMSFIRNTNNINVLLQPCGTRSLPSTGTSVRIAGTNGRLDFENKRTATEPTTYRPYYSTVTHEGQPYWQAAFRVLKLEKGDDTVIRIYEDGTLAKEESLTGLILQYFPHITSNDDFNRYSDYTFVYDYDPTTGDYCLASISVEGWTESVKRPGGI